MGNPLLSSGAKLNLFLHLFLVSCILCRFSFSSRLSLDVCEWDSTMMYGGRRMKKDQKGKERLQKKLGRESLRQKKERKEEDLCVSGGVVFRILFGLWERRMWEKRLLFNRWMKEDGLVFSRWIGDSLIGRDWVKKWKIEREERAVVGGGGASTLMVALSSQRWQCLV